MKTKMNIQPGYPLFLGANPMAGGYNFAIEAPQDAEVSLLLYKGKGKEPALEIPLSEEFRTGRVYAVFLKDFKPENYQYNFLINRKVVPDPCAYRIIGRERFGAGTSQAFGGVRCGFLTEKTFEWGEDQGPDLDCEDMILYKVHVRGLTKQWKGSASKRGTFQCLKEMIPYWKELGINALELMPAYEFLEVPLEEDNRGMVTSRKAEGIVNYWGYLPGFYFAPKSSYAATKEPEMEVCSLVHALHEAGIACIMEMYFPSGTNPLTALLALQFWKRFYHVDGFHLVGEGVPLPLILNNGLLYGTKIFAQGYDLETLKEDVRPRRRSFCEYNDGFCTDMRRFLKSDEGMVPSAKYRMCRNPGDHGLVNYMACQDGFTLCDLVSYNYKHNEANGEGNQDGSSYNYSWNCGAEGPSRRAVVRQLRMKQMKNAFALLLLSQGTPMIYAGDEAANSQGGNNNAYCQDNSTGWVDWRGLKKNQELFQFVKALIAFRKDHPILHTKGELMETDYEAKGFPDVSFHGERAWYCNSENTSRILGIMYNGAYALREDGSEDDIIYIACNFYWEERSFALPNLPEGMEWKKVFDTDKALGEDFGEETYKKEIFAGPRSILVLIGKEAKEKNMDSLSQEDGQKKQNETQKPEVKKDAPMASL